MSQILSGVRVLDLSRMLAGPFCSQILADFGAEVIKVEDLNGDTGRWSPPMVGEQSAIFYTVNRNKKSIALDLKSEDGAEVFKRMVGISDVVIDQFRPGVMQRLGFGYDELSKINPRIICCSLSGYGMTGPMSEMAGHDINFLSMAGVIDITGGSDGRPCIPGVQIAGMAGGGMYAVIAILLALIDREKTGRGQFCDIAMLDGSISLMSYALGELFGSQRSGNRGKEILTGGFACYNLYRCKDDKYFSLGAIEGKFWIEFCQTLGVPQLINSQWDISRQDEMHREIELVTQQKNRDEWMEIFSGANICLTPVLSVEEMVEHPQVKARNMIHVLKDLNQTGIDLPVPAPAIVMSQSPAQVNLSFPKLGADADELLAELGFSPDKIQSLRDRRVIGS